MRDQSEFAKILKNKLQESNGKERFTSKNTANSESVNRFSQTAPHKEAWADLIGTLNTSTFAQPFHTTQYKKYQPPPKPRPANKLSQDQMTAFLFFAAHGIRLAANFTSKDVKKAFRSLAMKMHPDHGGNTQTFLELKAAQDLLMTVFNKK